MSTLDVSKKTTKQLIKTCYVPSRNGRKDALLITSRDLNSNVKSTEFIEDPQIKFYLSKPEYWDNDQQIKMSRPVDEMQVTQAPYREITKHIAALTGRTAEYELAGDRAKHLHHTNNVCGSDFDIEDIAIDDFLRDHDWTNLPGLWLKTAFYDIEVDTINHVGFADAEKAECAVNLITYYQSWSNTMYVYISEENNESMIEFCRDENRIEKLTNVLCKRLSSQEKNQICVKIVPCGDELNCIMSFAHQVQCDDPDTIGAWNARFDVITLQNRILKLGGNPSILFGNEYFPGYWWHKIDSTANKMEERIDVFITPTSWTWLDLLTTYAQIRKNFKKNDSYSLDAVATKHLDYTKEDMSKWGENVNIHNFSRISPEGFITYGVQDTYLLHALNQKTHDIEFLYQLSLITRTRMNSVFYKTIIIRNFYRVMLRDVYNRLMCNNWNTLNEGKASFRGGFVGDPNKNMPLGVNLGGSTYSQYIYEQVIDMDFSSMYPSIIRAWNISPDTLVGFLTSETNGDIEYAAKVTALLASGDAVAIARELGGVDPLKHLQRVVEYGRQIKLRRLHDSRQAG